MQLKYVDTKREIIAINRSQNILNHLHNAGDRLCNKWIIRTWCWTGTIPCGKRRYRLCIFQMLFITIRQVLTPGVNKATYLIASPFTIAKFADIMQSMAPEYPIIKVEKVEPEVYRVINAILETEQSDITVAQAYLQIVLARCIGKLNLVEKSSVEQRSYLPGQFLYISKFQEEVFVGRDGKRPRREQICFIQTLFQDIFRNFNQYLNDARLNYACHRLENTSDSITNICLDSGFESQRTFNRVFKERYKISPSDYRSTCVKEMLS